MRAARLLNWLIARSGSMAGRVTLSSARKSLCVLDVCISFIFWLFIKSEIKVNVVYLFLFCVCVFFLGDGVVAEGKEGGALEHCLQFVSTH